MVWIEGYKSTFRLDTICRFYVGPSAELGGNSVMAEEYASKDNRVYPIIGCKTPEDAANVILKILDKAEVSYLVTQGDIRRMKKKAEQERISD